MRYAGGFALNELFAASITTLDIIVVYVLLEIKEGKFALVIWTCPPQYIVAVPRIYDRGIFSILFFRL